MSLPRPSGLKQPSRIGRPSGLPSARPTTPRLPSSKATSAIAKSARSVGFTPNHADAYANEASKVLKGPEPSEDGSINTDDFKIGDRVWVSGTKPGIIAFIGEAQFAPGEWAGIVLDEPVGKNDGSVMGVRYFQCEPKRGVFSRLTKLYHSPQSPSRPPSQGPESTSSEAKLGAGDSRLSTPAAVTTNGTTATSSIPARPSSRLGMSSSKHLSTSSSSLNKGTTPTSGGGGTTAMRLPGTMPGGVKVGDRVLVSGSKPGVLRYIGETDFAKGVWAGVELDDPLGKNDGAVAGKRYFDCKPMHGLFAPVHKIGRPGGSATSTPSPHSRPLMSTSLRSSRERSGSQESVSSVSSTASSVSRSRVRLGVTALASQASKTGQRPSTLNLSATTAALQKALKEKEEHIEQLLRERDLERSEVARAAAHVDEAEGQLSSMKSEQEKLRLEAEEQIVNLRSTVSQLEGEKQELTAFLEEEKRKVEDLQFQLEEEALKEEGETKAVDDFQLKELERQAKKEKERADKLENEMQQLKSRLEEQQKAASEAEDAQVTYLDQIEELTYKLTQAESKVKQFESSRLEDGAKTSQVSFELAEKSNRVMELEELLSEQKRELTSLSQQLNDVKDELSASNVKRKRQDEYIQELTNKLNQIQDEHKTVMDELRNANSNSADLQRQLTASEAKADELSSDRTKLEEQLSELMKNSGDSSSQLAALNVQLTEKTRKLEDLQNDLSNSSQSLAKAEEAYQELKQQKDRELEELKATYDNRIGKLQEELKDLNDTLEKSRQKLTQQADSHEAEKKEIIERKDTQLREAQEQLQKTNEDLAKQQDQTQAHKQLLDKVSAERDELQYAKQQSEKQVKRLEGEKAGINTELIQAKVELTKLKEEVNQQKGSRSQVEDTVEKLTLELECLNKSKAESDRLLEESRSQKGELVKERDAQQQELVSLRGELQKQEIQQEEMKKELNKLQSEAQAKQEEMMQRSQTESDLLQQELASLKQSLQDSLAQSSSKDEQLEALRTELAQSKDIEQDRDRLTKEKAELMKEKEASEERCRAFIKDMEKESQKADKLESEVKSLQASEGALKRENSGLSDRLTQLELDLKLAKQEASNAQEKLATASAEASKSLSGDEVYAQLKDEAEQAKNQVDFLNSVIIDLQSKNAELQTRLSAMEDSGIHTNGDFSEPIDIPVSSSRAPPRLFCDICDMFDQHDTEDCPKQAMSESPEPTRHHGDRHNMRPYCEICEVFYELCSCGTFLYPSKERNIPVSGTDPNSLITDNNDVKAMSDCTSAESEINDFREHVDLLVKSLDELHEKRQKEESKDLELDKLTDLSNINSSKTACIVNGVEGISMTKQEDDDDVDCLSPDTGVDVDCKFVDEGGEVVHESEGFSEMSEFSKTLDSIDRRNEEASQLLPGESSVDMPFEIESSVDTPVPPESAPHKEATPKEASPVVKSIDFSKQFSPVPPQSRKLGKPDEADDQDLFEQIDLDSIEKDLENWDEDLKHVINDDNDEALHLDDILPADDLDLEELPVKISQLHTEKPSSDKTQDAKQKSLDHDLTEKVARTTVLSNNSEITNENKYASKVDNVQDTNVTQQQEVKDTFATKKEIGSSVGETDNTANKMVPDGKEHAESDAPLTNEDQAELNVQNSNADSDIHLDKSSLEYRSEEDTMPNSKKQNIKRNNDLNETCKVKDLALAMKEDTTGFEINEGARGNEKDLLSEEQASATAVLVDTRQQDQIGAPNRKQPEDGAKTNQIDAERPKEPDLDKLVMDLKTTQVKDDDLNLNDILPDPEHKNTKVLEELSLDDILPEPKVVKSEPQRLKGDAYERPSDDILSEPEHKDTEVLEDLTLDDILPQPEAEKGEPQRLKGDDNEHPLDDILTEPEHKDTEVLEDLSLDDILPQPEAEKGEPQNVDVNERSLDDILPDPEHGDTKSLEELSLDDILPQPEVEKGESQNIQEDVDEHPANFSKPSSSIQPSQCTDLTEVKPEKLKHSEKSVNVQPSDDQELKKLTDNQQDEEKETYGYPAGEISVDPDFGEKDLQGNEQKQNERSDELGCHVKSEMTGDAKESLYEENIKPFVQGSNEVEAGSLDSSNMETETDLKKHSTSTRSSEGSDDHFSDPLVESDDVTSRPIFEDADSTQSLSDKNLVQGTGGYGDLIGYVSEEPVDRHNIEFSDDEDDDDFDEFDDTFEDPEDLLETIHEEQEPDITGEGSKQTESNEGTGTAV